MTKLSIYWQLGKKYEWNTKYSFAKLQHNDSENVRTAVKNFLDMILRFDMGPTGSYYACNEIIR